MLWVPARAFGVAGASVHWDASRRTVTLRRGAQWVRIAATGSTARTHGGRLSLPAPLRMQQDRVLVPARLVADALGVGLSWDGARRIASLKTPPPRKATPGKAAAGSKQAKVASTQRAAPAPAPTRAVPVTAQAPAKARAQPAAATATRSPEDPQRAALERARQALGPARTGPDGLTELVRQMAPPAVVQVDRPLPLAAMGPALVGSAATDTAQAGAPEASPAVSGPVAAPAPSAPAPAAAEPERPAASTASGVAGRSSRDETAARPAAATAAPASELPDDGRKPLERQGGLAQVVGVQVHRVGGRTRVDILQEGTVGPVQPLVLSDPPRLVFDLPGAQLATREDAFEVGGAVLRRVRLGQQAPDVVRATLDLDSLVGFTLQQRPGVTTVLLNHEVRAVYWIPRPEQGGQLWIEMSGYAPVRTALLENPLRLVIDIQEATLTRPAGQWAVSSGPVQRIRVSQYQPDVVRIVLELGQMVRPRIFTSAEMARQALGSAPAGAPPGGDGADAPSGSPGKAPAGLDIVLDVYSRITRVALQPLSRSAVSLVVEATGPLQPRTFVLRDPHRIVVDLPGAVVDPAAVGPEGRLPGAGPVVAVRAGQYLPRSARIVLELTRPAGYRLFRPEEGTSAVLAVGSEPLSGRVVAVDAGHGGADSGAVGRSGTLEKQVNLDIARRLAALLEAAGARVVMTRNDDVFVPLDERVEIAQRAGAEVLISIHNNASTTGQGTGTEVLYSTRVPLSRLLAELLYDALVEQLGQVGRGVKVRNDLRVLRQAPMPAALVEVAFVDHPEDERRLQEASFRQRAAEALFSGLVSFLSKLGTHNTAGATGTLVEPGVQLVQ